MTVSDRLRDDDEYIGTFFRLVHSEAEGARLDGEELRAHGFTAVEVAGMDRIIWQRAGRYFTTERALSEVRPIIEDEKEDS